MMLHGSSHDGWTWMNFNAPPDDVYMFIKGAANSRNGNIDGVVCMKASLHLLDVYPTSIMKFLKGHRLVWIRFNYGENFPSYFGPYWFPFPVKDVHELSDTSVLLGNINYED
ncbi:hypothetical protein RD792_018007 [Penstemon davidsonii]|uniref:Uncharacterized protein n=1 Tax=Penstemon davidsonii TaxID=160366 RepID=A0ABR0DV93_9LAMI|nr:hypothetical protein RD792_018007 [Penstemon davidsonii]